MQIYATIFKKKKNSTKNLRIYYTKLKSSTFQDIAKTKNRPAQTCAKRLCILILYRLLKQRVYRVAGFRSLLLPLFLKLAAALRDDFYQIVNLAD